MHVPIHNECYIFVYKHWCNPHLQLYKSAEDATEAEEVLTELSEVFDGVFLSSPVIYPRDKRNLEALYHIAPSISEDFTVFAPAIQQDDTLSNNRDIVVLCNYLETSRDKLKEYIQKGIRTAIGLDEDSSDKQPPWELANQIANLMDESGGGDYVWVSTSSQQDDGYLIQLCEELSYLDVPGPTMKSRLILDCHPGSDDVVDQVMMMGVSKFVVHQQEQLQDCIQTLAEEQGKQLVKSSSK